ncbi:MAG: hypothetical protein ACR2HO_04240, partial [Rubrobacteraceae bacterium]
DRIPNLHVPDSGFDIATDGTVHEDVAASRLHVVLDPPIHHHIAYGGRDLLSCLAVRYGHVAESSLLEGVGGDRRQKRHHANHKTGDRK